uniref:Transmembrane domain-containing protein n=1 Tax=Caenorhabditis tropicalis TaxID=1561998 RepID=A0A1I7ULQ5_9PELO
MQCYVFTGRDVIEDEYTAAERNIKAQCKRLTSLSQELIAYQAAIDHKKYLNLKFFSNQILINLAMLSNVLVLLISCLSCYQFIYITKFNDSLSLVGLVITAMIPTIYATFGVFLAIFKVEQDDGVFSLIAYNPQGFQETRMEHRGCVYETVSFKGRSRYHLYYHRREADRQAHEGQLKAVLPEPEYQVFRGEEGYQHV